MLGFLKGALAAVIGLGLFTARVGVRTRQIDSHPFWEIGCSSDDS